MILKPQCGSLWSHLVNIGDDERKYEVFELGASGNIRKTFGFPQLL